MESIERLLSYTGEFTDADLERGRILALRAEKSMAELVDNRGEGTNLIAGNVRFAPRIGYKMYLIPKGAVYDVRKGFDASAREQTIVQRVDILPIEMRYLDISPPGYPQISYEIPAECKVDFEPQERFGEIVLTTERKIGFMLLEHDIAIVEDLSDEEGNT